MPTPSAHFFRAHHAIPYYFPNRLNFQDFSSADQKKILVNDVFFRGYFDAFHITIHVISYHYSSNRGSEIAHLTARKTLILIVPKGGIEKVSSLQIRARFWQRFWRCLRRGFGLGVHDAEFDHQIKFLRRTSEKFVQITQYIHSISQYIVDKIEMQDLYKCYSILIYKKT